MDGDEKDLWATFESSEGEDKAKALINLSYISAQRGDHRESLALCETARDICEFSNPIENKSFLAHIYFGIGYSLRGLKRFSDAALALEKSVLIYQEIGSEDANHILCEEGDAWMEAKEYLKAYEAYRRVIETFNPDTCDIILARNYSGAGMALQRLEEWEMALDHYLEARKIYKTLREPWRIVHCDEEISLCYFRLNDGVNALHYAELALDFAVTAQDEFHILWAKTRLALAKKLLGEHEIALELFTEAKSIMLRLECPDWRSVIKTEHQIAELLDLLGRNDESSEVLRRIKVLEEIIFDGEDDFSVAF